MWQRRMGELISGHNWIPATVNPTSSSPGDPHEAHTTRPNTQVIAYETASDAAARNGNAAKYPLAAPLQGPGDHRRTEACGQVATVRRSGALSFLKLH